MRLAEALIERAEIQKQNASLISRMSENAKVQEGDEPAENPLELLQRYQENMERLEYLIQKINYTNSVSIYQEKATIADTIAHRDSIKSKIKAYQRIASDLIISPSRYSTTEIRFVRTLDLKEMQAMIDKMSKEFRQIDTKLQELNWTTDLIQ